MKLDFAAPASNTLPVKIALPKESHDAEAKGVNSQLVMDNARLAHENEMLRLQMEAWMASHVVPPSYCMTPAVWPEAWGISPCGTSQDVDAESTAAGSNRERALSTGTELETSSSHQSQSGGDAVEIAGEVKNDISLFAALGTEQDLGSANQAALCLPPGLAPETRTTMMMRNLPSTYTRNVLLRLLDEKGFRCTYDLVYVPTDFETHASFGYAFINFVCSAWALRLQFCFQGFSDWGVPSDKVCDVAWSDTNQGFADHVERYRNSPLMHPSVPEELRPIIFQCGVPVPFPPPTKKIRAPRLRKKE